MQDGPRKDSLADQLLELHNIQAARVVAAEEARLRAAEDARLRAEAEAKRRREEDDARLRAEEETRLAEERARQQEDELRTREAKQAELRVQLQEEAKARAAEQQRMLEHEKEMAAITAVERNKIRTRRIVAGGAVFLVLASLGAYAFVLKPALERQAMAEEMAKQEQRRAAMDKEQAEAALVTETERAEAAERDTDALKARLEKKEQAKQKAAASTSSTSVSQLGYFVSLVIIPMFWVGGVFFPPDELSSEVQIFAWFLPLSHVVDLMRGWVTGDLAWGMVIDVMWIVVVTAVLYWAALWSMRRRLIK